jgi:RimJ/RimL family protein N-acetyltransferase
MTALMATFHFVPASSADIPLLRQLAREIWHAHFPGIISVEQIDYMLARMYGQETIARELSAGVTWEIVYADETPIGYLSYSLDVARNRLNVHKLYVSIAWHGQGVGQAGLARIRDHAIAANVAAVSLFVNKRNDKAIRAYQRAGFRVAESLVNELGDGFVMDDYRMELAIGKGTMRPIPCAHLRPQIRWRSGFMKVVVFGVTLFAGQPGRRAVAAEAELYVSLDYQVDGSLRRCWSEAEFRRSVARRVGYDPFREDVSVSVEVRVRGSARAVDGYVVWRNAKGEGMGERRFLAKKDDNCVKLLTEMSFAVGLQIELLRPRPRAETEAASPSGGPLSGPAPAPATGVVAPPPEPDRTQSPTASPAAAPSLASPARSPSVPESDVPAPEHGERSRAADMMSEPVATPRSSRWPMWLGIGPSLALGIAPSATGIGRLFVGLRRGDLSAEVGAEASYPSTTRKGDGSGFRASLIGASVTVCRHRGSVSACALGKASQLRVTGLGVDQQRSPVGFVAQAGLRIAAALQLGGSWFATAHLDGLGLLTPCGVDLNQVRMWDMPRLSALAGIDVSARFR